MAEPPWLSRYDTGVPAELSLEPRTVAQMVARAIERHPARTALTFRGRSWRYDELGEEIERFATALDRLGVGPGTAVAVHLPNLPQTVVAYQAALRLGARVVLTNPMYTGDEVLHQWEDAGCEVAVTADFLFARVLQPIRDRLPLREIVVTSIPDALPARTRWIAPLLLSRKHPPLWARVAAEDHVHRYRELATRTPRKPPALAGELGDVAVVQYTGGTTGVSKGAMLTHANLSANVQQCRAWFSPGAQDGPQVMLACLPLFHCFGMTVSMNWALADGMEIVVVPDPRAIDDLLRAIERHRVTIFPGVPAMYNALCQHPRAKGADLSSLRVCVSGSAPLPSDVMQRFERLAKAPIVEGYGLSETSPVTHCNPVQGERRAGWIGLPLPNTDARIVDPDDPTRVLPPGAEGELCIRGPQVMAGYWNKPDETAQVLRDGWFSTGDLALQGEDGYFRIVGRKKDMINCSGFKVYPDEVDDVLMSHPAIVEAATIGVPDPERGETVRSYVVLARGAQLDEEALRAFCREHLAAYKVPREVRFVQDLPKSTVLKVLRRELREQALRELAP